MDVRGHSSGETGELIGLALVWLQEAAAMAALWTRRTLLQGCVLVCVVALLLWTSCFLYATFFYAYMPLAIYSTPVHFYYRSDCDSSASITCSFPTANISLLRNGRHQVPASPSSSTSPKTHQVMSYGQPHCVSLVLEMPESPANQELGMFMVRMSSYSRGGQTVTSSRRSALLRYRSDLVRALGMLLLLPALLTGLSEQRQTLEVELYSNYVDHADSPAIGAVVEIQSCRAQIYSSHLYIHSHYTGIRYLLFNFPRMSAFVGVATNFGFLSVLMLFGYLQGLWGQISPRRQRGDRSGLRQKCNGLTEESQMNQSETEYPEDDRDLTAEISSSSSDLRSDLETFHVKTSGLNQEEFFLHSGGRAVMDIRQRRAENGAMEETIPEGGVESMGISPDSELGGGLSDGPPSTLKESCLTS